MLIAVCVLLAVLLLVGIWVLVTYNGFIRLRNLVEEAWKQVDVELQRRHDLIPNLIETASAAARFERGTLDAVISARNGAHAAAVNPQAGVAVQAAAEQQLSGALGRFFAVAESYPQLQSIQNFVSLQSELANTEDRIAAGRRFYNGNVRELNTKVESAPSNLIAGMFGFARAEYFEIDDPAARAPIDMRGRFDSLG